jgi:hypothetical protein
VATDKAHRKLVLIGGWSLLQSPVMFPMTDFAAFAGDCLLSALSAWLDGARS